MTTTGAVELMDLPWVRGLWQGAPERPGRCGRAEHSRPRRTRGHTPAMALGVLLAIGVIQPAIAAIQSLPGPPTRWTVADGLPQGTINDVVQTPEGELWIATFGGLVRFDGLRFGVLDMGTMPELPGNRFTGLASDGGAGLWACTQDAQLVHLVEGRVLEVREAPGDLEALDLLRNDDGVLWVATSGGTLFRVDEQWAPLDGPGRPGFATLAREPGGGVLVGGERGLTHFAADGTRVAAWPQPRDVGAL